MTILKFVVKHSDRSVVLSNEDRAAAGILLSQMGLSARQTENFFSGLSKEDFDKVPILVQIKAVQALSDVNYHGFEDVVTLGVELFSHEQSDPSNLSQLNVLKSGRKITYKFDNNLKYSWIVSQSLQVSDSELTKALHLLNLIEHTEIKLGKPIYKFTAEDVKVLIEDLGKTLTDVNNVMFMARRAMKLIEYVRYSVDLKAHDHNYIRQADFKVLLKNIKIENDSQFLTLDELEAVAFAHDNPQNSIIPMLLYFGVVHTLKEETSELIHLRKDDLSGNVLHVRGDHERDIALDEFTTVLYESAAKAESFTTENFGSVNIRKYVESDLLLRPNENRQNHRSVTRSGVRYRVDQFGETLSEMFPYVEKGDVKPSFFTNLGKMQTIDADVESGTPLDLAIVKMMGQYVLTNTPVNRSLYRRRYRAYKSALNEKTQNQH